MCAPQADNSINMSMSWFDFHPKILTYAKASGSSVVFFSLGTDIKVVISDAKNERTQIDSITISFWWQRFSVQNIKHKIKCFEIFVFQFSNFTKFEHFVALHWNLCVILSFCITIYLWMQTTIHSPDNDAKEGTH